MYTTFYGLQQRPFDLSPDPRFLFLSNGHREALTHLRYGLSGRPGVTVLIGEAGTGKTTLVRTALNKEAGHVSVVHLSNPMLTRDEFFQFLAAGFGFGPDAAASKTRFLQELERALCVRASADSGLALIADEAQSLPHELMEEIRLLTNAESRERTLMVALVGQPELAARLEETNLRQLKQRIALRCELAPLDLRETAAYIASRIRIAGGTADGLFTRDAVVAIHEHSRGIPRTINVLCDNALVNGFAADVKPVNRTLVLEVCRDFALAGVASNGRHAEAPTATPPPGTGASSDHDPPVREPQPMFGAMARPRRFSFF